MNHSSKMLVLVCVVIPVGLLILKMVAFHRFLQEPLQEFETFARRNETEKWLQFKRRRTLHSPNDELEPEEQSFVGINSPLSLRLPLINLNAVVIAENKTLKHKNNTDRKRRKRSKIFAGYNHKGERENRIIVGKRKLESLKSEVKQIKHSRIKRQEPNTENEKFYNWKFNLNITRYENHTVPSVRYNSSSPILKNNSTDKKYLGMAVYVEGRGPEEDNDLHTAWNSVGDFLRNLFGSKAEQELRVNVKALETPKVQEGPSPLPDTSTSSTTASSRAGRFLFNFWRFGVGSTANESQTENGTEQSASFSIKTDGLNIGTENLFLTEALSSVTEANVQSTPNAEILPLQSFEKEFEKSDDVEQPTTESLKSMDDLHSGRKDIFPKTSTVTEIQDFSEKLDDVTEFLFSTEYMTPNQDINKLNSENLVRETTDVQERDFIPRTKFDDFTTESKASTLPSVLLKEITTTSMMDREKYCMGLLKRSQKSPRLLGGFFDFFGSGAPPRDASNEFIDNSVQLEDSSEVDQQSFWRLEKFFSSLVSNSPNAISKDVANNEIHEPIQDENVKKDRGARFLGLDRWFPNVFGSGSIARQVDSDSDGNLLFDSDISQVSPRFSNSPSMEECESIIKKHLLNQLQFSKPNLLDILNDPDLTVDDFPNDLNATYITESPKIREKEMAFVSNFLKQGVVEEISQQEGKDEIGSEAFMEEVHPTAEISVLTSTETELAPGTSSLLTTVKERRFWSIFGSGQRDTEINDETENILSDVSTSNINTDIETMETQERRFWNIFGFGSGQRDVELYDETELEANVPIDTTTIKDGNKNFVTTERQNRRFFKNLLGFGSGRSLDVDFEEQEPTESRFWGSLTNSGDLGRFSDSEEFTESSQIVSFPTIDENATDEMMEHGFSSNLFGLGSGRSEDGLIDSKGNSDESKFSGNFFGSATGRIEENESVADELRFFGIGNLFGSGERSLEVYTGVSDSASTEVQERFLGLLDFGSGDGRSVEESEAETLNDFTSTESHEPRFLGFLSFGSGERSLPDNESATEHGSITQVQSQLNISYECKDDCEFESHLNVDGSIGSLLNTSLCEDDCYEFANVDGFDAQDNGMVKSVASITTESQVIDKISDNISSNDEFLHENVVTSSVVTTNELKSASESKLIIEQGTSFPTTADDSPRFGGFFWINSGDGPITLLHEIESTTFMPPETPKRGARLHDDQSSMYDCEEDCDFGENLQENEIETSKNLSQDCEDCNLKEIPEENKITSNKEGSLEHDCEEDCNFEEIVPENVSISFATSSAENVLQKNVSESSVQNITLTEIPAKHSFSESNVEYIEQATAHISSPMITTTEPEIDSFPAMNRDSFDKDAPVGSSSSTLSTAEAPIKQLATDAATAETPEVFKVHEELGSTTNLSQTEGTALQTTPFTIQKVSTTSPESDVSSTHSTKVLVDSTVQPLTTTDNVLITKPDIRFCTGAHDCDSDLNERCVTRHSASVCDCGRGYVRHPVNRKCDDKMVLETSLRFPDEKFHEDLNNPESDIFKKTAKSAKDTMTLLLGENPELLAKVADVQVSGFSAGSLVVRWNLVVAAEGNETLPELVAEVDRNLRMAFKDQELLERSPLKVNNVVLLSISKALDPCSTPELNYCSSHASCRQDPGRPAGFRCECKNGFPDTSEHVDSHPGEVCQAICPENYCGANGLCRFTKDRRECLCNGWYFGDRCQISGIVVIASFLAVNVLLVFVVVLILCLTRCKSRNRRYGDGSRRFRRDAGFDGRASMRLTDVIAMGDVDGNGKNFRFAAVHSPIGFVVNPGPAPDITVTPASLSMTDGSFDYDSTFDTTPSDSSRKVSVEIFEDPTKN